MTRSLFVLDKLTILWLKTTWRSAVAKPQLLHRELAKVRAIGMTSIDLFFIVFPQCETIINIKSVNIDIKYNTVLIFKGMNAWSFLSALILISWNTYGKKKQRRKFCGFFEILSDGALPFLCARFHFRFLFPPWNENVN